MQSILKISAIIRAFVLRRFAKPFQRLNATRHSGVALSNVLGAKSGLSHQTGQVKHLLTYLLTRRGDDGLMKDVLDVDWEESDDTISRLFYTSALMIEQFRMYGQFLDMDATCKTNRFNMPLVLLVGMDNTKATTIFGMGLMLTEDIESYTWMLRAFKRAVGMRNEHISAYTLVIL